MILNEFEPQTKRIATLIGFGILTLLLFIFILPWHLINWGTFSYAPAKTVTVTGFAEEQQANQIATFTAGVTAVNEDKQAAIDSVNSQMESIIASLKEFGIPESNIQTQSLNIYQEQEPITENGRQRMLPGQWRVSNDIQIRLENIDQTQELVSILSASGATNVYGPNFTLDNREDLENQLIDQAITDAQTKAEAIAQASNQRLGQILAVNESGTSNPGFPVMEARGLGGGGDTPVEPGSSTVTKTLTVTFQLK